MEAPPCAVIRLPEPLWWMSRSYVVTVEEPPDETLIEESTPTQEMHLGRLMFLREESVAEEE